MAAHHLCGDLDAAFGGELDGVADEVVEDLLQSVSVGMDERRVRRDVVEHLDRLQGDERTCERNDNVCDNAHVHCVALKVERAMAELGEVEDVIDEVCETTGAGAHHFHVLPLRGGQRTSGTFDQRFSDADDAVERSAQLVRGVGEETVLHRVGVREGLAGLLLLGVVVGDHHRAAQLAVALVLE